jgi:hypothetical protein
MAQAVSRRPPTAEGQVRSEDSSFEISGEQSGLGTRFSPSTLVFPVIIIPPMLLTHFHEHVALTRRTNLRSLGNFQCCFGNRGALDRK